MTMVAIGRKKNIQGNWGAYISPCLTIFLKTRTQNKEKQDVRADFKTPLYQAVL